MKEIIIISILVLLFLAFLYWAYLPDYRRNPQEFWKTLIGMPIGILLGYLGLGILNENSKNGLIKVKMIRKNIKKFFDYINLVLVVFPYS